MTAENFIAMWGHNSGAFDGIKLGGVRMNYGIICGENNQRL